MPITELNDSNAVASAIKEFDEIGRDRFLQKYGFGPARRYFLVEGGQPRVLTRSATPPADLISAWLIKTIGSVAMRPYFHLSDAERDQIAVLRAAGQSIGAVAEHSAGRNRP